MLKIHIKRSNYWDKYDEMVKMKENTLFTIKLTIFKKVNENNAIPIKYDLLIWMENDRLSKKKLPNLFWKNVNFPHLFLSERLWSATKNTRYKNKSIKEKLFCTECVQKKRMTKNREKLVQSKV